MAIQVEIEGKGAVAEFPDGTPDSVIDAAIKRDFFGAATKAPPGFFERLLSGGGAGLETEGSPANTEAAKAILQAAPTVASGLASWIPAGLSMVTPVTIEGKQGVGPQIKLRSPQEMAKTAFDIQEALTIKPPTPEAELVAQAASLPFEASAKLGEMGGEYLEEKGYPILGAASRFAGEAAPFLIPVGLRGAKAIRGSDWYRSMTIKERGLVEPVIERMAVDIEKGDLTVDQIRELWKDKANKEALLKRYQGVGETEAAATLKPEAAPAGEGRLSNPIVADAMIRAAREKLLAVPEGMDMGVRPNFTMTPNAGIADLIIKASRGRLEGGTTPMLPPLPESDAFSPELAYLLRKAQETKTLPLREGIGEGFESRFDPSQISLEPPKTTQKPEGGNPFKKSVVQEPVYRGDTVNFDNLDRSKITNADFRAFFFTKDRTYAPIFANYKPKGVAESDLSPTVRQAYISLENPLDLRDKLSLHPELASIDKEAYGAFAKRHTVGDFLESVIQERTATIERRPFNDAEALLDGSEEGATKYRESYSRAIAGRGFATPEAYETARDTIDYLRSFRRDASFEITDKIESLGYDGLIRPESFTNFGGPNAKGDVSYAVFNPSQVKFLPNPSRPSEGGGRGVFSERGSTGPLDESEILNAILKARGKVSEAMPHLEALGKSVYESGKTAALDWLRAMKGKLGDLWDTFKGYMRDVYARLHSGKIGPMKNQKGAVGKDINQGKAVKQQGAGVRVAREAAKDMRSVLDDVKDTGANWFGVLSTRLENINPGLKYTLRQFEYRRGQLATERTRKIKPFLEKVHKMPEADRAAFDMARKNGDGEALKRLVIKHGLGKEYHDLRIMLKELRDEALAAGYDVGYLGNYHPRHIKDTKGFLKYMYKQKDWPILDRAIRDKEAELDRYLTEDEKAKLINSMLRGYPSGQIKLSRPGAMLEREIDTVTPELNEYYADSDASLLRYIHTMTDAVEAAKLFGKGKKGAKVGSMDDTIGAYVLDLLQKGKIRPDQERELTDLLKARFNEVGTTGFFGLYKNIAYIDTMGSPISAVTQIGDLAWALYKNGLWQTAKATGKAVAGRSLVRKEDLGIDRIASEFSDMSKSAKAVEKIFQLTGLNKIDAIGKEALVNSTWEKAQQKVRTPKGEADLRKELSPIFEGETDQVIADIKAGRITENVKLYLFNTLADVQPIALSEMPQSYLTGGNGRVFYILKTFTIKQFDVFRREAFRKMNTPGQRVQGMKNLIRLAGCFVAANAGADVIKDLILGRPIDLDDKVVDNLFRLFGVGKFVTWQARTEGPRSAIVKQVAPPFKILDAVYKDIATAGDGKGLETTASIPLVGKLYYWWFGKGYEKSERQRERDRK